MDRPAEMFDREYEWSRLAAFAVDPRPGAELGVVCGRRRQGKTFLLRALCQATGGFYFAADEATDAEALRRIGAALADHLASPGPLQFDERHPLVAALLPPGGGAAYAPPRWAGRLGGVGGPHRARLGQPAVPRGSFPAGRRARAARHRHVPPGPRGDRRRERGPRRHGLLPRPPVRRPRPPADRARGLRADRAGARRLPFQPGRLPDRRAAGALLPRSHRAQLARSGTHAL